MKIISWNVNGIRAVAQKNFFTDFQALSPDVLCLQETKAQEDQVIQTLSPIDGYYIFPYSAEKKGYSGTAIITKTKPISVSKGIGMDEHDQEGRVICAEFEKFFLINVYVPNSGSELKRLGYRQVWDLVFFHYLKKMEEIKPVIACGDFNVAHTDIDLANPKANYNKFAGYMQEEIDGMYRLTRGGFVDSFRHFYPGKKEAYSWWSYRSGARANNVGWRIDYFLVSASLIPSVRDASILDNVLGSDHCPVAVELK